MSIASELALLANTKENLRVSLGLSKDVPFSRYARSVVPIPRTLFMGGEKGFWADPSDASTLFQNSDGTIAVVDGDPIGLVLDKTGNNYNLTQTVSASRPKLLNGGIVFDRVDDRLELEVPAGGITGTLFLATTRGTASYGVSIPEGVWTLGSAFNPLGDVVSAVLVDRALSDGEKARLQVFGIGKGGTEYGDEISYANAWRGWTHLVDFPLIDTSRGVDFLYAWRGCSGLTSFPVLDVSKGEGFYAAWYGCTGLTSFPELDVSMGNSFGRAWEGCTGLTSFPALDVSSGTNFTYAWANCSGLTSFPVLDVSSGTNFSAAWYGCSGLTSFPVLDVSSGTNFSHAWQYCSRLTSFPALDVSSGTNFYAAWSGCSGLTSFPALDVSSGTIFTTAWANCSGLTSFPVLDVSSGTDFRYAWQYCSRLTSFPVLDVSSGTNFSYAWRDCSGLTSFPANFFDNCLATSFTAAFNGTNLSQESIDGILVSINSNGTSNGTFDQSGGSAPSVVGQSAIDAMRSRGWTVSTTGGY